MFDGLLIRIQWIYGLELIWKSDLATLSIAWTILVYIFQQLDYFLHRGRKYIHRIMNFVKLIHSTRVNAPLTLSESLYQAITSISNIQNTVSVCK